MTREEALNFECVKYATAQGEYIDDVLKLVNSIYDEFEGSTCDNCSFNYDCGIQQAVIDEIDILDFGCNKFERK